MQNDFWKMVTTVSIWVIIAGMCIAGMVAGSSVLNSSSIETITISSMILATIVTGVIWVAPALMDGQQGANTQQEKSKRGGDDKLALLLDLMDEDERRAFKETLKQRYTNDYSHDGEIPYDLYDYVDEEARQK